MITAVTLVGRLNGQQSGQGAVVAVAFLSNTAGKGQEGGEALGL